VVSPNGIGVQRSVSLREWANRISDSLQRGPILPP
jgi:hypothetical protein